MVYKFDVSMLVDSHCHLSFKDLGSYSQKTIDIIKSAEAKGVTLFLDVILKKDLITDAINFSAHFPYIYNAFGIHPCDIEQQIYSLVSTSDLVNLIKPHKKIIGVGETGLDYHYSQKNKNLQIQSFINHCEVANKLNLPLIVHTRDSTIDTINILKEYIKYKNIRGVIHCFCEDISAAKQYLDLGFFISFSGIVTFKNAIIIQDSAKFVPLNRILVETDSPYLAPVPYRGKINQPAYTYYVAEYISCIKNIEYLEFAQVTTNNFKHLFNI